MTCGVSLSRKCPFSARAGDAKASAIKAMQTPRSHSDEPWKCIAQTGSTIRFTENSDRIRKIRKNMLEQGLGPPFAAAHPFRFFAGAVRNGRSVGKCGRVFA